MPYTIIHIPCTKGRSIPLLYLDDTLFIEQVAYMRHLLFTQHSPSTLYRITTLIGIFWTYLQSKSSPTLSTPHLTELFESFIDVRLNGDSTLNFKPVSPTTLNADIGQLSGFFDYIALLYDQQSINPKITKTSPYSHIPTHSLLFYLFSRTSAAKGHKLSRSVTSHISITGTNNERYPSVTQVQELIHNASLRDQLLWMLLAYGGIRGSEALNLFYQDISITKDGQALIKLKHPSLSKDTYVDPTSLKQSSILRSSFLTKTYNLHPRHTKSKSDPYYSGWKGIYYENKPELTSYVHWATPSIGRQWAQLHLKYMEQFRLQYANIHPYYFISLRGNAKGNPLKLGNLRLLFSHQSDAANFTSLDGLGCVHSLRHFYKYTLRHIGQLDDLTIMRFMHHCSLVSTTNYGTLSLPELHKSLQDSYSKLNSLLLCHPAQN